MDMVDFGVEPSAGRPAAPSASRPLQTAGRFIFRSPASGLLIGDSLHDISTVAQGTATPAELAGRALNALDHHDLPTGAARRVVGGLPFDGTRATRLFIPGVVTTRPAEGLGDSGPDPAPTPIRPHLVRTASMPNERYYMRAVAHALERINGGALDKVVLARCLDLTFNQPVDAAAMLDRLLEGNPRAFVFSVPCPATGRVFFGASPELLVRKQGRAVIANPLAGSMPCSADPAEDERRASALLASDKNRREHALVRDAVADTLAPYCRTLDAPLKPSLIRTGTLWHLSTCITGELRDPTVSSLELAAAQHPTPAVCGRPHAAARQAIGDFEPFDRGLYAGMVGWCDETGDGEWAVALRCAEADGDRLRLFAGAGIVAGSSPQDELTETAAKFHTIQNALGVHATTEPA